MATNWIEHAIDFNDTEIERTMAIEATRPVVGFGRLLPCKPDIFAATYEPVASTDARENAP